MNNTITQKEVNKMNVKPKFLNVMKQRIFTLMMMLALVIVTGSAWATNEKTVTKGGTYNYNLTGVKVNTIAGSTLTVDYTGAGETITSITHNGTAVANGGALPSTTSAAVTFTILYDETTATSGNISVTVVDGGTGGCSNNILLAISVVNAPTVDLTIANVTADCQGKGTAGDNTDAAGDVAEDNNTWTYVVTISLTNVPVDYSGTATLALSGAGSSSLSSIAMDGLAATPTGVTFDAGTGVLTWDDTTPLTANSFNVSVQVRFTTTEGLGDLALNLDGSSVSVTETVGGETYNESVTNNNQGTSTVYAMPAIGTFN